MAKPSQVASSEAAPRLELLSTKLYVPAVRRPQVLRARLVERLNEGSHRPLVLLSAPAGFGKTTLLSAWIRERQPRVAWISLDESDNDPARFLAYLRAALASIHDRIGNNRIEMLQGPGAQGLNSALILLANELDAVPQPFWLVLDDYHAIHAETVHSILDFFLNHLPAPMHLILSTRADPPLPLARLRAKGQLVELRAVDMRFIAEESSAFLNQVMGLNLTTSDIEVLNAKTEGWVAGLQLAALALQTQGIDFPNPTEFISRLSGSNRFIFDFMTDEVLRKQPPSIQDFMLRTCILDRLTAPLCDAVTGQGDGQNVLDYLEQGNLFISALDDHRQWYRYHRLFADLLRHRLQLAHPDEIPLLHRRAAAWLENAGLTAPAIEHALASADFSRAARLLEMNAESMLSRGETVTLLNWLQALPEEQISFQARLSYAWALVFTNQLDAAQAQLEQAERTSRDPETEDPEMVALRASIASGRREVPRAIELSRQALDLLPEGHLHRSTLLLNLGYAYREQGDVERAADAFREATRLGPGTGNLMVALIGLANSGNLQMSQGHLHQAEEIYRQAFQLATAHDVQFLPIVGIVHITMGMIFCEWNELEAAGREIREGIQHAKDLGSVNVDILGDLARARLLQAQGDLAAALGILDEGQRRLVKRPIPNLGTQLAAFRARLLLAAGNLGAASAWAARRAGHITKEEGSWPTRFYEKLVHVRVLIAQGKSTPALEALDSLERAIRIENREGNLVEVYMLQALALNAEGNGLHGMTILKQALALAESEGFIRLFANEGAPMARLLSKLFVQSREGVDAGIGISPEYLNRLLVALGAEDALQHRTTNRPQTLIEPLSERELEVLRLIAAGLSNREIAQELQVEVGTIKTHINNLYGKLNVHSRIQAAARAKELDLF